MKNLKRITALIIVLLFSIAVVGCGSKTVAIVNGEKITKTQLDKVMKKKKMALEQQGATFTGKEGQMMLKALEQQALEDMITKSLILQAAKKEGVYPSKSEINKQIDEIKARYGGEKAFKDDLKRFGYTIKEMEELVAFNVAYNSLYEKVTGKIEVTDSEVQDEYNNNKDKYVEPAKIKARAIFIRFNDTNQSQASGQPAPQVRSEQDAEKMAMDIIKELDNGADFAKLAEEKSEDERFKSDGGLIKDVAGNSPYSRGSVMLPKEFDDAVMKLKAGKYTQTPVKTQGGYYIIKLESLTPEKQMSFEESKDRIKQTLLAGSKQAKFDQYIADLRSKANIQNSLAKSAPQIPTQPQNQQPPASK